MPVINLYVSNNLFVDYLHISDEDKDLIKTEMKKVLEKGVERVNNSKS